MTDRNHFATLLLIEESSDIRDQREHVESGVASMIAHLEELPGLNSLSVATFAEQFRFTHEFEVPTQVRVQVDPNGGSALWDSVALATLQFHKLINQLPPHTQPANVQVIVVARGIDTASTVFGPTDVRVVLSTLIKELGWDFRHFAVGPNARTIGSELGFHITGSLTPQ